MNDGLRVALVQIGAGRDAAANLRRLDSMLGALPPTDLIALPEVFAFRGSEADFRAAAERIPGPTSDRMADLARRARAWVLAGSIIENENGRIFNTSVLLNPSGRIAAAYRKMHLFEAELENGQIVRESDAYEAGDTPAMVSLDGWSCGMAICYDLRFPELFRHYSAQGADIMFVPSNFTQRTGKDHWEVLVRARAIENQCFVVAPNQCGTNEVTGVASHGHSMIVGPWGEILAEAGDGEGVAAAVLSRESLAQTRRRIPCLSHRRAELRSDPLISRMGAART